MAFIIPAVALITFLKFSNPQVNVRARTRTLGTKLDFRVISANLPLMPCDSLARVKCLIQSDRSFVRTCIFLYVGIFAVSIGVSLFLMFHPLKDSFLPAYSGFLINGLAIPLVLKHLQRSGALKVLDMLRSECDMYQEADPKCQKIWDDVDSLMKVRGGI